MKRRGENARLECSAVVKRFARELKLRQLIVEMDLQSEWTRVARRGATHEVCCMAGHRRHVHQGLMIEIAGLVQQDRPYGLPRELS